MGFVDCFEIDLATQAKNERYQKALSELNTILFAVVFGLGLSEFSTWKGWPDFTVLLVAYIAITLSWWGYHYGCIKGPSETNFVSYVIDVFIVVCYWLLINKREPLWLVATLYSVTFVLYFLWESVRHAQGRWRPATTAMWCNLGFVGLSFVPLALALRFPTLKALVAGLVFGTVAAYRLVICRIYKGGVQEAVAAPRSGTMTHVEDAKLVSLAEEVRQHAFAPLSGYRVGAALLTTSGKTYAGCNVEFANYSNTIHAEEAAIAAAVADGEREIAAVAVRTEGAAIAWPCGMCLQSLFEIGGGDLRVIASNGTTTEAKELRDLLPHGFRLTEGE